MRVSTFTVGAHLSDTQDWPGEAEGRHSREKKGRNTPTSGTLVLAQGGGAAAAMYFFLHVAVSFVLSPASYGKQSRSATGGERRVGWRGGRRVLTACVSMPLALAYGASPIRFLWIPPRHPPTLRVPETKPTGHLSGQ